MSRRNEMVLRITTAYEQGVGHALTIYKNPYTPGSPEGEAWDMGREFGIERTKQNPLGNMPLFDLAEKTLLWMIFASEEHLNGTPQEALDKHRAVFGDLLADALKAKWIKKEAVKTLIPDADIPRIGG